MNGCEWGYIKVGQAKKEGLPTHDFENDFSVTSGASSGASSNDESVPLPAVRCRSYEQVSSRKAFTGRRSCCSVLSEDY